MLKRRTVVKGQVWFNYDTRGKGGATMWMLNFYVGIYREQKALAVT